MSSPRFRARVAHVLAATDANDRTTRTVNALLLALIFLNGVALVVSTVEDIYSRAPEAFELFESVSVVIFSVEYLLRLWSAVELEEGKNPIGARVRWFFSPMALVDFLAVLPFYLPVMGVDLRSLRLLRLLRVFRLLKIARYSRTLQVMANVARAKKADLVTVLALLAILLVMAATLVYYAEHQRQPDAFSSIPQALWWAIASLTTVGYGDVVPVTALGRLLGGCASVLGLGLFALPAGILSAGFVEEIRLGENRVSEEHHEEGDVCEHCGARRRSVG